MDFLIPLPFVIAGALAALGVGYVFALITTDNRHRKIAAERETQIQDEYADYKRDVSEHFSQSSRLFSQVTDQYRQLYLHMADGARLLGGTPPTPMIERLERERSSSRQSRTEPQLLEGGLDDALVELRDDLQQFTTRLETRRKQSEENAKKLAKRSNKRAAPHAAPASATAPIDLSPETDDAPEPQASKHTGKSEDSNDGRSRARHRSAQTRQDVHVRNSSDPADARVARTSSSATQAQNRVRSQPRRKPKQIGADGVPVLDTNTLRTTNTAKALDDENVKWQKLVDEWNPDQGSDRNTQGKSGGNTLRNSVEHSGEYPKGVSA